VGLAGRFPGAHSADAFWQNVRDGVESITVFSDEQLIAAGVDPALLRRPEYVKAGAVLDGAEWFDASFFGFSPREAEILDPQHRLFLECAWEALEIAGYDPSRTDQSIGVFAGAGRNTYFDNLRGNREVLSAGGGYEAALGNESDFLATRTAYKLNLRGPSLSVQTSCSTSLVAVHVASQHLLMHQCDVALAGGVFLGRLPATGYLWQPGAILSPDGHCRAFDARAQGAVAGRGVGVVVLKRLADALADGDTIRAIIRGSAVNNDGSSKVSYTAPSVGGQAEVIAEALAVSGVPAETIGLIESHGTGTALGDPAEIAALTKVYRAETSRRGFCAIGSVKTNIGHLDVAAGVTGLIKTVLALEHRALPPSLHFSVPNPEIDFEASPFFVNTTLRPWVADGPRRAAVSAFGIGGTNAHVIVEEAPVRNARVLTSRPQVLAMSARTRPALDRATENLAEHLAGHKADLVLTDVAFTLQAGRRPFEHRRTVVCRDIDEAVALLRSGDPARVITASLPASAPSIVFVLPASGVDRAAARRLYEGEPAFRTAFDAAASAVMREAAIDLLEWMNADRSDDERVTADVSTFAYQYGVAGLLGQAAIRPAAMVADGVGEIVAGCIAGVFSLEVAVRLIRARTNAAPLPQVGLNAPAMPIVLFRTGSRLSQRDALDGAAWIRLPDFPGDAITELTVEEPRAFVELAAIETLAPALRAKLAAVPDQVVLATAGRDSQLAVLAALGQLWTLGCDVDWTSMRPGQDVRRVPLPTYPFDRQRFWVEPHPESTQRPAAPRPGRIADRAQWFRRPVWTQGKPLARSIQRDATYVFFSDECGVATALAELFTSAGSRVLTVAPGEQFEDHGSRYSVRPAAASDYERLLARIAATTSQPVTFVHLWGVTRAQDPADATLDRTFFSTVALTQALARKPLAQGVRIVVLTSGVHAVTGDEALDPVKAAVLGPCRVVPQEIREVACRHVDILAPAAARIAMLADEINADDGEATVAHRGPHRWVRRLEPVRIEVPASRVRLRDRGVYLITGGTGGIGLTLAGHLADSVRARLVLVSRTPLPARSEWARVTSELPRTDSVVMKIRQIEEMERAGAEVVLAAADVTDAEAMHRVVAQTRETFGRIDGVIHAAGVAGGGLAALKTREAALGVLAPKVHGVLALDQALAGAPLDFFVLCSSLHGVVGGVGQVDYSGANAVLDAYAQQRWVAGDEAVVAIDWDAWRDVGMAVTTPVAEDMRRRREESLRHALTAADGVAVFDAAIGCGLPQLAVYTQDFDALLAAASGRAADEPIVEERPRRPKHPRPVVATPLVLPQGARERLVCNVFEEVLAIEQVGRFDSFFDLGGHSLLTVDIVARIKERTGIDLPIARLYEGDALSPAFVSGLLDEIEAGPSATPVRADLRVPPEPLPAVIEPPHAAADRNQERPMRSTRSTDRTDRGAVAIVGMSARFPGAATIDEFWRNLRDGVESRRVFSDDELRAEGFTNAALRHPKLVKSGFVLDDIDKFDAAFFGINPREAELLDPQHRLFLECAWNALENAGYDGDTYDGAVAVFGGATMSGYLNANILRNANVWKTVGPRQAIYGSVPDYMVTRVAYKLNLKGPCYFVQTACSTSLVAVHLACQALNNDEADLALAGGVSVQVPHSVGYVYEDGGMMSPDGTCRTFDASARGTVFGSGVGIVVLKRLDDALRDGDTIHAVVRGTATNNDGSLKVGFTAPSVVGQSLVVSEALANAGVAAADISYVEAHGTGTELGDPIEVAALTRAFRSHTDRRSYCALGSVKPNIGHLDAAAGVSSLIKTVLAMKHQQIPPTINFERPNPKIDFDDSPFYVNTALAPWPANGTPRRAGVSSFGFGGTNAHVIVEEAPAQEGPAPSRSHQILTLSARTEQALNGSAAALAEHLRSQTTANLAEVAFTGHVGRRAFGYRRAIVCNTREEAIEALEGGEVRRTFNGFAAATGRPVVFLFPGQGTQYVGMAQELYREEPLFREIVDTCSTQLRDDLGIDLRDILYPASGPDASLTERLTQTAVTQSALFVIEYALARLWMSWGITPAACIGHSIGEFTAACISGVLTLPDALRLVALRGRLMEQMPSGVMAAVPLPENRIRPLLGDGLWLAAINAPSLSVVSGERDRVAAFVDRLAQDGIECRLLHTSHAFHSGMMEPAVGPFVEAARAVKLSAPTIPYVSNVTGDWVTEALVTRPEYWGQHIRQAVRFADGIATLLKQPDQVFVEVGPGNTLSGLLRQQTKGVGGHVSVSSLPHAQEQASASAAIATAVARLWVSGAALEWPRYHANERRRRVPLPTYPFERQRFWIAADKFNPAKAKAQMAQAERQGFSDWFQIPSWKRSHALAAPAAGETAVSCLVFEDEAGVAAQIEARLEQLGHRITRVQAGASFAARGPRQYELNPAARDSYTALLRAMREAGELPSVVVHAWGVTRRTDPAPDAAAIAQYEERGFYSLMYLAQAIGELGMTTPMRLTMIADGLYEVSGDETLVPEKAAALGPVRVIPKEFANISARAVDLQSGDRAIGAADLDMIVADVLAASTDREIAYRNGRRWIQCYEQARLQPLSSEAHPRLRDAGVYLLTGGLGGISLVLARYLAERFHARLVLTGRRGLPARDAWDAHLAQHGPKDAVSRRIAIVRELEALGAEVLVGEADVTDEARMRAVVDAAYSRFGRIDGVVHAAGVAGAGMIQLKTREAAAAVLAPKIAGTRVLARIFRDRPLDFLALCSSTTAVLGPVGQIDYCAANAYLDAFAQFYAAETGTCAVAIDWAAWREVGMAVDTQNLRENLGDQMLEHGLSNEDGVEAFRRILADAHERIVAVSPFDLQLMVETMRPETVEQASDAPKSSTVAVAEPAAAAQKLHPRPVLQSVLVAPRNEVEKKICRVWQEMLGIEPVGIHDNFFELGGHSLLAVRVMARVNETLHTEIPIAKLYEGLTVGFLAALVARPEESAAAVEEDADAADRRREKAKRQREHQMRRRVALGR
jgi:acyl transferase domain-containing protein/acyl carrier protein